MEEESDYQDRLRRYEQNLELIDTWSARPGEAINAFINRILSRSSIYKHFEDTFYYNLNRRGQRFEKARQVLGEEVWNQIKPKVEECNRKVVRVEAADEVSKVLVTLIFIWISLVVALAAGPLIFPTGRGVLHWLVLIPIISLLCLLVNLLLLFLLDRQNTIIWLFVFTAGSILLASWLSLETSPGLWQVVLDGFRFSFIGVAVSAGLFTILHILQGGFFTRAARRLRFFPEEDIIDSLSWLLGDYLAKDDWSLGDREIIISEIEYIANVAEKYLPKRLKAMDDVLDAWQRTEAGKIAYGIRRLKRYVLLPKEGDKKKIREALCLLMKNAIVGCWDTLGVIETPKQVPLRSRIWTASRKIAGLAIPLLVFLALNQPFMNIPLDETAKAAMSATVLTWLITGIVSLVDPDILQVLPTSSPLKANTDSGR
jgi:hypothetical protein